MLTISEAIGNFRCMAETEENTTFAEECRQIAEWLEELRKIKDLNDYRFAEVLVTHKTGQKETMILDRKYCKLLAYWMTAELALALGNTWEEMSWNSNNG